MPDNPSAAPASPPSGNASNGAQRHVRLRTLVNYWLDAALLLTFTIDYSLRFTGLTFHEWIGVGLGFALLAHLTLHWDWAIRTTRNLVRRTAFRERLRWLVDLSVLGALVVCTASGVLISRYAMHTLGWNTTNNRFWRELHGLTADASIALVAIHVALSWRWILTVTKRSLPILRVRTAASVQGRS